MNTINPKTYNKKFAVAWLKLAVAALGFGGIFSVLLVLARSPKIQEVIPYRDFFHTALIAHVNLSVLTWFLAMTVFFWVITSNRPVGMIGKAGLYSMVAGTALLTISPFVGNPEPVLSNYIPMLTGLPCSMAIALIGTSMLLMTLWKFQEILVNFAEGNHEYYSDVLHLSAALSAVIIALTLLCFGLSGAGVIFEGDLKHYFELLYWGGGHALQFNHTQVLMACWLVFLALPYSDKIVCIGCGENHRCIRYFLWVNMLVVLALPFAYLSHSPMSAEFYNFFTVHMRHFGGIAVIGVAAAILIKYRPLIRPALKGNMGSYLICSFLLFVYGGVLGHMISGHNVTIPAHYHGSIVGISIALMGIAVYFLPELGFRLPSRRFLLWQPVIYAAGQAMHITGLAWSGGYGAIRKSAETIISPEVKAAMGLMGAGGLIAIIGGLIFVLTIVNILATKSR